MKLGKHISQQPAAFAAMCVLPTVIHSFVALCANTEPGILLMPVLTATTGLVLFELLSIVLEKLNLTLLLRTVGALAFSIPWAVAFTWVFGVMFVCSYLQTSQPRIPVLQLQLTALGLAGAGSFIASIIVSVLLTLIAYAVTRGIARYKRA